MHGELKVICEGCRALEKKLKFLTASCANLDAEHTKEILEVEKLQVKVAKLEKENEELHEYNKRSHEDFVRAHGDKQKLLRAIKEIWERDDLHDVHQIAFEMIKEMK